MEKELFSPMDIDALGEMMNISLGSSATAVSNLLDHRVDITTPKVTVVPTAWREATSCCCAAGTSRSLSIS